MRHATHLLSLAFSCLLVCAAPDGRAAEEQDKYEEQTVARCAERALKAAKNERTQWIKELEGAFGKVTHATTEDEYATWFSLLAGKGEEWRRDDSTTPAITELFDKVLQRLELGPVPSIKRDEFAKFTKRLMRDNPQQGNGTEQHDDADKVFRVLDRNGDGELDPDEFTAGLKGDKLRADIDGNGRISKDEYREYFQRKVTTKTEAMAASAKNGGESGGSKTVGKPKPGGGLPEWFTTLDTDKDGQIALYEWRKSGRPVAQFTEMDLNGDGFLTRDEYLRWVKMNDDKLKQEKREEKEK